MKTLTVPMTAAEVRSGWGYLLAQLFCIPWLITSIHDWLSLSWNDAQLNFLFYAVNFLAVVLIFRKFLVKTLVLTAKRPIRFLRSAFIGLLVYQMAFQAIVMVIGWLLPDFANLNDQHVVEMTRDNLPLVAIGTVFLVPVAEELFYRGLVFGQLQRYSRVVAYTVSTFFFCCIHVVPYLGMYDPLSLILSFLQYIPAGLCLAWAYESADSLLAPILIHMTINQIGISTVR